MMGAASTAISDPPPPTPGPSQALNRTQPPNRRALSSTPAPTAHPRKPKSKNVPSRYLSPSPATSTSSSSITTTATATSTTTSSSSSSRRFTSPLLSRSTNSTPSPSPALKRSQSVDRRRPSTARPTTPVTSGNSGGGEVSAAAKLLITSTRSLSVSFQGEAFSLPVSKAKKAATPERRRATPTPVRDQGENSKPTDQQTHRWPGRTRQANSSSNLNSLSRSVDYSRINDEKRKLIGFGSGSLSKLLQQSMIDESSNGRRMSFDGRLSLDLGKVFLKGIPQASDANSLNESNGNCDLTASDTDSVSSGSTNGVQECGWTAKPKSGPRGILMSARFWQETNSRLRRLQDPGSPLSTSPGSRIDRGANKLSQSKRFSSDSPLGPSQIMASPIRGAMRPASPSKLWASTDSSPSRGMPSPSRVRPNSTSLSGNSCAMPSILSFSMDVRRGKIGEDRIVEAHLLRLLYNRHLQWRFVNARADAAFSVQRLSAEKNLWNAWVTISELRHTVSLKRMKLLLLRQKLKLTSILKGQIAFLDEWSLLDKEHTSSFLGAAEALRASTLRLPVVGKATADVTNLKDAMGSAVDVMQAMASSICSLSSKVEEMNSLVAELVNVSVKERLSLDQCRDFLSGLTALQVKDCSLRTHTLQLHRVLPAP